MAGMGQGLFVGVAVLGMVALGWAASAEPIPLPTPAPLPKERGSAASKPAAPAQSVASGVAAGVRSLFHLDKDAEPPATPATTSTGFTSTQRAQVDKVSAYLSNMQQLIGDFVQVGPDGSRVRGEFYIQKPGKVRFEYEPPSRIEIVADGQSVIVRDRKLATQDLYPLSQTPLRFLLSERIDLMRETNIIGVRADDTFVTITIEERQPLVGTSRLVMMVGAKDYQLKQWTITDPQGYDTTVAVSNLDNSKRPDPSLFKIDYTRYVQ
jgi:outer membrane lipoprotein-sorting protein